IFCYPGVATDRRVLHLLATESDQPPQFGYKPLVPLCDGKFDRTEVDMRLGNLLVEAKLTEGDFQRKNKDALAAYRDFTAVFDRRQLPQNLNHPLSYQLIRTVLAAPALGCSFLRSPRPPPSRPDRVLVPGDAGRPPHRVARALQSPDLAGNE